MSATELSPPLEVDSIILGAGPAGIGLGVATGWPILEARPYPGGICSSYYVNRKGEPVPPLAAQQPDCYRFEHGGGHWLFGLDEEIARFLSQHSELDYFSRNSGVFFPDDARIIPYPIQHHLEHLPAESAEAIRHETAHATASATALEGPSLHEWLLGRYGPTLCNLFFFPFHDLYTCGLQHHIAAQDEHKSPSAARASNRAAGYNVQFAYPLHGLDHLFRALANRCQVYYEAAVTSINVRKRMLILARGGCVRYRRLYSTLPLNLILDYAGLRTTAKADPAIGVHVLNFGARKGRACPPHHWVYVPHSQAGFHRIGFYSNVTTRFLPQSVRDANTHSSIYVERCLPGPQAPSSDSAARYAERVVSELKAWQFIDSVETISHSWVSPGYTWSWIGSQWKTEALQSLKNAGIVQLGRYGRWTFQGIADSLAEGMRLGKESLSCDP